jgi:hypothetical protein
VNASATLGKKHPHLEQPRLYSGFVHRILVNAAEGVMYQISSRGVTCECALAMSEAELASRMRANSAYNGNEIRKRPEKLNGDLAQICVTGERAVWSNSVGAQILDNRLIQQTAQIRVKKQPQINTAIARLRASSLSSLQPNSAQLLWQHTQGEIARLIAQHNTFQACRTSGRRNMSRPRSGRTPARTAERARRAPASRYT